MILSVDLISFLKPLHLKTITNIFACSGLFLVYISPLALVQKQKELDKILVSYLKEWQKYCCGLLDFFPASLAYFSIRGLPKPYLFEKKSITVL